MPLVIIAKSFGGTFAKQLFIKSNNDTSPEVRLLHSYIRGFMFFSTIHQGGPSEDTRQVIRRSFSDCSELDSFFNQVNFVNQEFEALGGLELPIACFYETEPISQVDESNVCMSLDQCASLNISLTLNFQTPPKEDHIGPGKPVNTEGQRQSSHPFRS